MFAGVDGAYVLRNLALDGNTFRKSHNVDREPIVGNFMTGLGFTINRFKINFAHGYQTKAFETQEEEKQYGSMTLSYTSWADTFGAVKYPCATGVGTLLIWHMTLWHALCPLKRLKVIS